MSGLEALSLVCNIMTVITFARDTIITCKKAYKGDVLEPQLSDKTALMVDISTEVQSHHIATQSHTQTEKRLADVAKKCQEAAKALEDEVNFILSHQKKGDWVAAIKLTAKTRWRARRLERLTKSMDDCKSTLETALLAQICTTVDALRIQQCQEFHNLGDHLKSFITQYAAGKNRTEDLVTREFATTRRHTTHEVSHAKTSINTHIDVRISSAQEAITGHTSTRVNQATANIMKCVQDIHVREVTSRQRDILLQSLKFPAMNERRNQIPDVFEGSFSKIFNIEAWSDTSFSDTEYSGPEPFDTEPPKVDSSKAELSNVAEPSDAGPPGSRNRESDEYESNLFKHHDSLVRWMQSDHNLYWVTGKPGSGKSTLAKFLLFSPLTLEALRSWDPDLGIISHFFWKAGAPMQSNSKGFLCSLLYQLLNLNESNINQTIAMHPWVTSKDSVTDWSTTELRNILFEALPICPRSLCIFVDGLDEVCDDDGPSSILALIDEIRKYERIKICVFSRPEPRFRLQLDTYPHLTIHELTSDDMLSYARGYLKPYWRASHAKEEWSNYVPWPNYDLFSMLIEKSDGVFLWLRLALGSLREGLQNGDSMEELIERLEALPSDLSEFFLDMWERANRNAGVYRKKAAQYLNLAVISQGQIKITGHDSLSLCQLTAITEPSLEELLNIKDPWTRNRNMEDLCHETIKLIQIKTAGLSEVVSTRYPRRKCEPYRCDKICTCSISAMSLMVQFTHRAAYDFLKDTEGGRRIRQWDDSSEEQCLLQLARGIFTELRFGPVHESQRTIDSVLKLLSVIEVGEFRTTGHSLLREFWSSYDEWGTEFYPESGVHFLAHVAQHAELLKFMSRTIRQSPSPRSLATRILCETLASWSISETGHSSLNLEATLKLLRLGADPNVMCSAPPSQPGFFPTANACATYLKMSISCLQEIDHDLLYYFLHPAAEILGPLLREFLERNPDMDAETLLKIRADRFGNLNLRALIPGFETLSDPIDVDDKECANTLTLVVNTRLLMEVFLQLALRDQQLHLSDEVAWPRNDLIWAKSYTRSLPSHGPEATMLYVTGPYYHKALRVVPGKLTDPVGSVISWIHEASAKSSRPRRTRTSSLRRFEAKIASESKSLVEEPSMETLYSEMAESGFGTYVSKGKYNADSTASEGDVTDLPVNIYGDNYGQGRLYSSYAEWKRVRSVNWRPVY